MASLAISLSISSPIVLASGSPDGVIQMEVGNFLQTEDGNFLAFD